MSRRIGGLVLAAMLMAGVPAAAGAASPTNDEPHAHPQLPAGTIADPVLEEQIAKVQGALDQLHEQMAQRRLALQQEPDGTRKAALYAELDGLRKERDLLERLLHDLVDEAKATEWTAIDEALKRARTFERRQEGTYQREEAIRDRQQ